jgi:LPS-assembly lipoprotein
MRRDKPHWRPAWGAIALVALLGLSLSGCGYQLRGTQGLPADLAQAYVKARTAKLDNILSELIASSGATRVSLRTDASLIIIVDDEELSERLLSVDPNTGKAREFEVSYSVQFQVDAAGRNLIPRQRLRIVRDYVFDGDAVIGKSRERGVLQSEMRQDIARQIFNRIRAAYRERG